MEKGELSTPAPKRVLLVEDEMRLRGIIARYLRARGHVVFEAGTVETARSVLATEFVHVLLLDVNLEDGTCWDVLRWIERWAQQDPSWGRPRVVVLSAVPPSAKRVQEFKPDAVLNKPFPIDALGRLVESGCVASVVDQGFSW
jgi:DNA-binding response OmpR family regulator